MLDIPSIEYLTLLKRQSIKVNENGDIFISEIFKLLHELKIKTQELVITYFSESKGSFLAAACDPVPPQATIPMRDSNRFGEVFIKLIEKRVFHKLLDL